MYWYESDVVGAFPRLLSMIGGFFIGGWMTPPFPPFSGRRFQLPFIERMRGVAQMGYFFVELCIFSYFFRVTALRCSWWCSVVLSFFLSPYSFLHLDKKTRRSSVWLTASAGEFFASIILYFQKITINLMDPRKSLKFTTLAENLVMAGGLGQWGFSLLLEA